MANRDGAWLRMWVLALALLTCPLHAAHGQSDASLGSVIVDLSVGALDRGFEATYAADRVEWIEIEQIIPSPSGDIVGISLAGLTRGDPEEVWLVEPGVATARRVAEGGVYGMAWLEGDTLEVRQLQHIVLASRDTAFMHRGPSRAAPTEIEERRAGRVRAVIRASASEEYEFVLVYPSTSYLTRRRGEARDTIATGDRGWQSARWTSQETFFTYFYEPRPSRYFLYAIDLGANEPPFVVDRERASAGYSASPVSDVLALPRQDGILLYDLREASPAAKLTTGETPRRINWWSPGEVLFTAKACSPSEETPAGVSRDRLCAVRFDPS